MNVEVRWISPSLPASMLHPEAHCPVWYLRGPYQLQAHVPAPHNCFWSRVPCACSSSKSPGSSVQWAALGTYLSQSWSLWQRGWDTVNDQARGVPVEKEWHDLLPLVSKIIKFYTKALKIKNEWRIDLPKSDYRRSPAVIECWDTFLLPIADTYKPSIISISRT